MGVKVAKFGGSSVADAIQMNKMKEIIEADPDRRYVVVSAPGKRFDGDNKITDLLLLCITQLENNVPCDQIFQVVRDRFNAVRMNLDLDIDMDKDLDEIQDRMKKGASRDYIVSRGEFLAAKLVAAFLGFDFIDTEGLIMFGKHGRVDQDETDAKLAAELKKHANAVLPGFYGTSIKSGEVETFSRGGSDVTGSLVARAVKADVYENWTDVSGFLMADPRIVKGAKPIGNISYMELRELSYMGASVLHEDAIYPVRDIKIPINIRNTNKPDDEGTIITAEHDPKDKRIVTGIAGHKNFTVISMYKNTLNSERGFVRRLLSIIEDHGISFEHIPTGIDTVSIVISNDEVGSKLDDVIEDITVQLKPDKLDVYNDIALIATVGCGMSFRPGVSAKIFNALAESDVNVRMIDQGSSEINIIIGVANKDFNNAIKAIYNAFSV